MTKKEYCNKNTGMAILATSNFSAYVMHGIEFGVKDHVYITYQANGKILSCHRLLIRYNAHYEAYVVIGGNRFYLNDFLRLEVTR